MSVPLALMSAIASAWARPGASIPSSETDRAVQIDRIRITSLLGLLSSCRRAPFCPIAREGVFHLAQRLVEDAHGEVDVLAPHRERRRDPPHRAALGPAADVHAQAKLQ